MSRAAMELGRTVIFALGGCFSLRGASLDAGVAVRQGLAKCRSAATCANMTDGASAICGQADGSQRCNKAVGAGRASARHSRLGFADQALSLARRRADRRRLRDLAAELDDLARARRLCLART